MLSEQPATTSIASAGNSATALAFGAPDSAARQHQLRRGLLPRAAADAGLPASTSGRSRIEFGRDRQPERDANEQQSGNDHGADRQTNTAKCEGRPRQAGDDRDDPRTSWPD
jgi:hypothetical protein